jgi:hypothetical protein
MQMDSKKTMKVKSERLVCIADLHCGHRTGLTPPEWQMQKGINAFFDKIHDFESDMWKWFSGCAERCKPVDILVVNGDAIDGKGDKSGGTELLTADRVLQGEIAKKCIQLFEAKHIVIINGTPYHTGKEEDFEAVLACELKAHYANHEFIQCGGVGFDFKHKVSSSVIPHGRWTAPRRAALWNSLQAERGLQPNVDILVRSHVHYYTLGEDQFKTVITSPALQGWSKYGSRECEGTNDVGFLQFDCEDKNYDLTKYFFDMRNYGSEFLKFK